MQTLHAGDVGNFGTGDSDSWVDARCPHCGAQHLLIVARAQRSDGSSVWRTDWLRCSACLRGSVTDDGTTYPSLKPLREPRGLPDLDSAIWEETRNCLGVGANAAAVMLCRKLLFHIAVAHGLPAKGPKDRAPSFVEAVDHLESQGVITKKMRPWVDRIKDVGNDANHELSPITAEAALDVATFTQQLLVLAYELDVLMENPDIEVRE